MPHSGHEPATARHPLGVPGGGVGGLAYGAGSALAGREVPEAVVVCGLALVVLALFVVEPPARITWTRGTARVATIAFAVLGAGLIMAGMASLAGLLGPATPAGFRDNDLAAVATCFGALALVFAYASYRSMRR